MKIYHTEMKNLHFLQIYSPGWPLPPTLISSASLSPLTPFLYLHFSSLTLSAPLVISQSAASSSNLLLLPITSFLCSSPCPICFPSTSPPQSITATPPYHSTCCLEYNFVYIHLRKLSKKHNY